MPHDAIKMTRKFIKKPKVTCVKRDELVLEGIQHEYIDVVVEERKLGYLYALYEYENVAYGKSVIFVNTRCKVHWLSDKMRARNHVVLVVPQEGMMDDKKRRDAIVREFLFGSSAILITANMFACDIDVQMVDAVINYDIPMKNVPRSSGSIRYSGVAINFVTVMNKMSFHDRRRYYNVVTEEDAAPKTVAKFVGRKKKLVDVGPPILSY